MVAKSLFYGVTVVLVAMLVISSAVAIAYYDDYQNQLSISSHQSVELEHLISRFGSVLQANMLIDFGNGTRHWFNGTQVQPGWNLYTLTLAVTNGDVNSTCCEFGSHFVTGIYGVQNQPSKNEGWIVWTYNATSLWQPAQVGVDQIDVFNDSTFAWTYCPYNPNTGAPECPGGSP
jgi:hypothetical protein